MFYGILQSRIKWRNRIIFVLIKEHLKLSKENIISLFEDSKFRNFTITNVVIFDKDVIIDISINNPTLQARKKIESSITGLISQKFGEKINLKINTKIEKLVNDYLK